MITWTQINGVLETLSHFLIIKHTASGGEGGKKGSEEYGKSPIWLALEDALLRTENANLLTNAVDHIDMRQPIDLTGRDAVLEQLRGALSRYQFGQFLTTMRINDDAYEKEKESRDKIGQMERRMHLTLTQFYRPGEKVFQYLYDVLLRPVAPIIILRRPSAREVIDVCIRIGLCDNVSSSQKVLDFLDATFNEVAERILVPLNERLVALDEWLTFHIERYVDPNTRQERRAVHAAVIGRGAHFINNTARLVGGIATVLLLLLLLLVSS